MPKTIATVEFEVPGHFDKYLSIESDQSLLDYEIIVFTPDIRSMFGYWTKEGIAFGHSFLACLASERIYLPSSGKPSRIRLPFTTLKTIYEKSPLFLVADFRTRRISVRF
jgi:hypothetical protein